MAASNHSDKERQVNDYYATDPKAIDLLLENERFDGTVWECACGQGHMAERLKQNGYSVNATDLVYRGYGEGDIDFLLCDYTLGDNIITNPPYMFRRKKVFFVGNGKKERETAPFRGQGKEKDVALLYVKFKDIMRKERNFKKERGK